MSEVQTTFKQSDKKLHTEFKKLSTRIDLTPMVDLGFLLITFFIFTTTLSKPTAMKLTVPAEGDSTLVSSAKTLNIILLRNNMVGYYNGNDEQTFRTTNYSGNGIRSIIQQKQKYILEQFGDSRKIIVLIKATTEASYKNIVDVLDEMVINDVHNYFLSDADNKESPLLY